MARPLALSIVANGCSVPASAVGQCGFDPAAEARLVLRTHDRPLPERGIEGDQREVRQVVGAERFQADPRALQDDRLHPRLRPHAWHGNGGGRYGS